MTVHFRTDPPSRDLVDAVLRHFRRPAALPEVGGLAETVVTVQGRGFFSVAYARPSVRDVEILNVAPAAEGTFTPGATTVHVMRPAEGWASKATGLSITISVERDIAKDADEGKPPPAARVAPHTPPLRAEFLLSIVLSTKNREHVIGDLQEEYSTFIVPRYGLRRAQWWYRAQVAKSVVHLINWKVVKRLLEFLTGTNATAGR